MEYVFYALAVLIILSLLLKLSFTSKWEIIGMAVAFAVWIGMLTPWLTEQSKPEMMAMLEQRANLMNLSLGLIVEALLMMAYCLSCFPSKNASRGMQWGRQFLHFYPGLMFGVVQAYVVGMLLFAWTGIDFTTLQIGAAAVSFVLVSLGAWGIRILLPEKALRWELLFILNVFIIVLSVVAGGNS